MTPKATLEDVVSVLIEEGECKVMGFGTFKVSDRKAYRGRNPKTGDPVDIPASKTVTFKPSAALRSRMT